MFERSIDSLLETVKDLPVEIIVIDNCASEYAADKVNVYIKNSENIHFGMARNQGLSCAHGNYIVIADNDIEYQPGWLEACWEVLEAHPEKKLWATPIQYPTPVMVNRYDQGTLDVGDKKYRLNMRAGSNCFVVRRKDFEEIGTFEAHRIAGSKWNDVAVRKGYVAAVTPENMVKDLGLRLGYNLHVAIPIKRTLTNGEEIYFNQDEWRKLYPEEQYYDRS